jgi:transcriptional antiterminator NusG
MENKDKTLQVKWYVASTQSGQENTVRNNILKRLESSEKAETVLRLIVAEIEEEVLNAKNETVIKKRNLYPGYIFLEMEMSDEMWFLIRNTPGVTGFIGSSGRGAKPFPVDYEDIEPILKRLGYVDKKMYERYKINDYVRIIDGPFVGTEGQIIEIDKETGTVKIETTFFGRVSVTEINFALIEKVVF